MHFFLACVRSYEWKKNGCLTLHSCCPGDNSSNGWREKHFEHANSITWELISSFAVVLIDVDWFSYLFLSSSQFFICLLLRVFYFFFLLVTVFLCSLRVLSPYSIQHLQPNLFRTQNVRRHNINEFLLVWNESMQSIDDGKKQTVSYFDAQTDEFWVFLCVWLFFGRRKSLVSLTASINSLQVNRLVGYESNKWLHGKSSHSSTP